VKLEEEFARIIAVRELSDGRVLLAHPYHPTPLLGDCSTRGVTEVGRGVRVPENTRRYEQYYHSSLIPVSSTINRTVAGVRSMARRSSGAQPFSSSWSTSLFGTATIWIGYSGIPGHRRRPHQGVHKYQALGGRRPEIASRHNIRVRLMLGWCRAEMLEKYCRSGQSGSFTVALQGAARSASNGGDFLDRPRLWESECLSERVTQGRRPVVIASSTRSAVSNAASVRSI
jgi:hypothetical protein